MKFKVNEGYEHKLEAYLSIKNAPKYKRIKIR